MDKKQRHLILSLISLQVDGKIFKLKNSGTIAMQLVNKSKNGDLAAVRLMVALIGPEIIDPSPTYPSDIKVTFVPPRKLSQDIDDT